MYEMKPHVLIRKGAVLQGVRLSGVNIILETEESFTGRERDIVTVEEVMKVVSPECRDVQITDCGVLSLADVASYVTAGIISKSKDPLNHLLKSLLKAER